MMLYNNEKVHFLLLYILYQSFILHLVDPISINNPNLFTVSDFDKRKYLCKIVSL